MARIRHLERQRVAPEDLRRVGRKLIVVPVLHPSCS